MAYATLDQLEEYLTDSPVLIDDPDVAERALERASRDIDNYVGGFRPYGDDGWRFNPADPLTWMSVGEIAGLERATCAQAEWRLFKGPEYFLEYESGTITGPDFTIDGVKHRWFSTKAILELRQSGLTITGARAVP